MLNPLPFFVGYNVGQMFVEDPDSPKGRVKCPYPENSKEEDQWQAGFDQALDDQIDANPKSWPTLVRE